MKPGRNDGGQGKAATEPTPLPDSTDLVEDWSDFRRQRCGSESRKLAEMRPTEQTPVVGPIDGDRVAES